METCTVCNRVVAAVDDELADSVGARMYDLRGFKETRVNKDPVIHNPRELFDGAGRTMQVLSSYTYPSKFTRIDSNENAETQTLVAADHTSPVLLRIVAPYEENNKSTPVYFIDMLHHTVPRNSSTVQDLVVHIVVRQINGTAILGHIIVKINLVTGNSDLFMYEYKQQALVQTASLNNVASLVATKTGAVISGDRSSVETRPRGGKPGVGRPSGKFTKNSAEDSLRNAVNTNNTNRAPVTGTLVNELRGLLRDYEAGYILRHPIKFLPNAAEYSNKYIDETLNYVFF